MQFTYLMGLAFAVLAAAGPTTPELVRLPFHAV